MKPLFLILTAACALTACTKNEPSPQAGTAQVVPVELPDGHPPLNTLPDPEMNGGHAGRAPRRISVLQLKESIITTTGREWSKLDDLASSLGKADYALVVSDSVEANLVFAKFLDDGAREVCKAVAQQDLTVDQEERVLSPVIPANLGTLPTEEMLNENLQYLAVRFWGSRFDEPELARWADLYKTRLYPVATGNNKWQDWAAVCVAMMTDQRFITY